MPDSNPQLAIRCCWVINNHLRPFLAAVRELGVLNQWLRGEGRWQEPSESQFRLMNEIDPWNMVSSHCLHRFLLNKQKAWQCQCKDQQEKSQLQCAEPIYEWRLLRDSLFPFFQIWPAGQLLFLKCIQEQQKMQGGKRWWSIWSEDESSLLKSLHKERVAKEVSVKTDQWKWERFK